MHYYPAALLLNAIDDAFDFLLSPTDDAVADEAAFALVINEYGWALWSHATTLAEDALDAHYNDLADRLEAEAFDA